jgi:hypothetical protein
MTEQLVTFEDIYTSVMKRGRYPVTNTTMLAEVKGFINERYVRVCKAQKWWWLRKKDNIVTLNKYTTGTITATSASTTITGSGTTFTSGMVNRKFKAKAYDEIYDIASFVSSTELTLADAYTGDTNTGGNYTVYQDVYDLPSDCEEIAEIWTDHDVRPMRKMGPREFREQQVMYPTVEGWPQAYTVLGFDDATPLSTSTRKIEIWPRPDKDYTMRLVYIRKPVMLDATTSEPLIPVLSRAVLMWGALADLRDYHDDERSVQAETMFNQYLHEMIKDREGTDDVIELRPFPRKKRHFQGISRYDLKSWFDKYG